MEHFYQSIGGYFTFPDYYRWLANQQKGKPVHGVEVGVYKGQSAAFLGVELINKCPQGARLDLVDRWVAADFKEVQQALEPLGKLIGAYHKEDSWAAANHYEDRQLDWVFIDADHDYASVCKDIDAWLPKVRPGGIIAGHDYCEWPGFGVIKAVNERFKRFEVWPCDLYMGDPQMQPHRWPVWSAQVE